MPTRLIQEKVAVNVERLHQLGKAITGIPKEWITIWLVTLCQMLFMNSENHDRKRKTWKHNLWPHVPSSLLRLAGQICWAYRPAGRMMSLGCHMMTAQNCGSSIRDPCPEQTDVDEPLKPELWKLEWTTRRGRACWIGSRNKRAPLSPLWNTHLL